MATKNLFVVTMPATLTVVVEAANDKDAKETAAKTAELVFGKSLGVLSVVGESKVMPVAAGKKSKKDEPEEENEEEEEDEEEEEEEEDEEEEEEDEEEEEEDDETPKKKKSSEKPDKKSEGKKKIKIKLKN